MRSGGAVGELWLQTPAPYHPRVPIKDALKTLHWSSTDFQPHPTSSLHLQSRLCSCTPEAPVRSILSTGTISVQLLLFPPAEPLTQGSVSSAPRHSRTAPSVQLLQGHKSPVLKCFAGLRKKPQRNHHPTNGNKGSRIRARCTSAAM